MQYTFIEVLGTIFFAVAVIHTFIVGQFLKISHRYPEGSFARNIFHLLGEIEVVFALWASIFMVVYIFNQGWGAAIEYQQSLSFVEPIFIFVIMVICSTKPILAVARQGIVFISQLLQKVLRTPEKATDLFVLMTLGPLAGSFITEPAAMTVTAFMLSSMLTKNAGKFIYPLIAILFVNVSIGGALTPFAAPPILMVAAKWGWDFNYVFTHLGWKSAIAVVLNATFLLVVYRKSIVEKCVSLTEVAQQDSKQQSGIPVGVTLLHLAFLVGVVVTGHYQNAFFGLFLLFLGIVTVTQKYQDTLRLKEALLVALFLGGIIQFGAFQKWWLTPLLTGMGDLALFKVATGLTAITDNAALTYLGSQVEGLSEASRYALVAGAIAGGGLTVIANAPNAAGYSILSHQFPGGIRPLSLLLAALVPTGIALFCLWIL